LFSFSTLTEGQAPRITAFMYPIPFLRASLNPSGRQHPSAREHLLMYLGQSSSRDRCPTSACFWQMSVFLVSRSNAWTEIGERSANGQDWQKFFEMKLQRK
jgi:hypothetical protein